MRKFMKRLMSVPLALAGVFACAISPAAAQVAGTYSGTTADGNGVSFTVATDPNTGLLAVTGAGIGFSDMCRDGSTLNTGWGYGLNQDIVARKVSNTTAGSYFTITFNLTFAPNGQSATGRIASFSPTLNPVGPHPTSALYCKSPMQSMSVTLQPPMASLFKPPAKGAIWLGKTN
jgi:hypothetical protein